MIVITYATDGLLFFRLNYFIQPTFFWLSSIYTVYLCQVIIWNDQRFGISWLAEEKLKNEQLNHELYVKHTTHKW